MENINVSFPNNGKGDKVINAFIKVNNNFEELNSKILVLESNVEVYCDCAKW